ncbi:MAG: hypothetical protein OYH76_08015 [Defluviicoccus sp.]|nr:hypothetical protein [Defluviicoccus sp.]MDE0275826.1 hypothetical protein [Defluviicoccus sp.]
MKMTVFEGTPEEIAKVARALRQNGANLMPDEPLGEAALSETSGSTGSSPASGEPKKFVTVEFARRVLTRRQLSTGQKIVLETLKDAYPEWVSRDELCAATDYTSSQLAGLMGAFGRRASHTQGYVRGSWLFDAEWDEEAWAYRYRLPDSLLEALRLEDVV